MHKKNVISLIQLSIICSYLIIGEALMGPEVQIGSYDEFSFVVPIIARNERRSMERNILCTGSVVTGTLILTAEHCFDEIHEYGFYVKVGSNDIYRATSFYPFWYITYDQWANTQEVPIVDEENDIGFIKLLASVGLSSRRRGVIASATVDQLAQKLFKLAGYGKLMNNTMPSVLHTGGVSSVSHDTCSSMLVTLLGEPRHLPDSWICTISHPYVQIGSGDSGGPLIRNNVIVGINRGLCPLECRTELFNQRINVHLSLPPYMPFVTSILNYY